ncbi:MAG: UvrD-helicase domain-containing protein [Phycisphaeraceae bacterium]
MTLDYEPIPPDRSHGSGLQHPHRITRASAGAGKTYQLTTRYLGLLALHARPEGILATTFTRKAAGEILGRVLSRLAGAAVDARARRQLAGDIGREFNVDLPLHEADCRAMLASLAESLHRLNISTIDSFFSRIASSFRYELDLPLEPQMVDESHPLARQLRQRAIEAMLADQDLPVLLEMLQRLHHDTAVRKVTQAMDELVRDLYEVYREAPDRAVWTRLEPPAGLLSAPALAEAIEKLRAMEEQLPQTKSGSPNKTWAKAWRDALACCDGRDWENFLDTGLPKKLIAGEETFSRAAIEPAWQDVFQPLIDHARADQVARLARQAEAMHDLLERFDGHYARLRRDRSLLLYADVTHKLARHLPSLGDELLMEVYFRLDAQVAHLMLDEFQDTSLEQWRVLSPFAEEIASHADGSRTFFCVGDTKQAIYGWRGGCVELFDEVEQTLCPDPEARQTLAKSWRSSPVVLGAVNDVFTNLPNCDCLAGDGEVVERWDAVFEPHAAQKQDLPGHARLITSPAAGDDPPVEDDEDEAAPASPHERFVAEQVAQLVREAPGRTVGVLVSRNRVANRLLFEMHKLGLPVSGEGGNPVTDSPAVAAVLSAMTLADHPGHSAAAFHVANSPLGEILEMTGRGRDAARRVAREIRQALLDEGYAGLLARWARQLAPSCDKRNLTRLTQLVDLAEKYGPIADLRPSQFVEFVENERVEEPTPAAVRVMTIHGAKGLEFDAVVLPDLAQELDRSLARARVMVHRGDPTGPVEAVYPFANRQQRELAPELDTAYAAMKADRRREDLCNLYVAMTRARHSLQMIVPPRELTKKGELKKLRLCFAAILREALNVTDEAAEGEEVLYERGDPAWASQLDAPGEAQPRQTSEADGPLRVRLARPGREARRSWLAVSPSSLEGGGRVSAGSLLDLTEGEGRQRGTLLHEWMSRVGFTDELDALPEETDLLAMGRQILPGAADDELVEHLAHFQMVLARPGVRAALERNGADELWRERNFAVRDGGRLVRGAFDRVHVWGGSGKRTRAKLIDFKSDRVSGAGVARRAEHYRPQIQAYQRALATLLKLPAGQIEAELLFLETGEAVPVEAAGG